MARTTRFILSALADWLHNPVIEIRLTDSDTVKQLEEKVDTLQAENHRLALQYMREVEYSMKANDKLKENGLSL